MTVLTRWDPFREFSTMQDRMNRMNRLFRESYSPEGPEEALTTTSFAPPVDIYEDEHNITLKIEVPGIDEKDIDVRIENNTLTAHGEREKWEAACVAFPFRKGFSSCLLELSIWSVAGAKQEYSTKLSRIRCCPLCVCSLGSSMRSYWSPMLSLIVF